MLTDKKAVIFDLDGTLVDSMWMWEAIDIEYLARFQIPVPEGLQNAIEGLSFSETAHYFKEHFHLPDSIEKIKKDWNEMAKEKYEKEVFLKPGAMEFLKQCKEKNLVLGIATSNSRELVDAVIQALRLEKYFSCIMTACEVQKGKPAPDIYFAVADKLSVNPSECLVFEDIVPGILAGKNAGMQVCAVKDQYSEYQKAEKKETADYYIDSYYELLEQ